MGNCKNLDHAKHNEKVCDYLNKKSEFADWIITTAFYSSFHYIRHKIIPYNYTNKSGESCEYIDFESLFENFKQDGEGRHGFQARWVSKHFDNIRFEYQRLYELSQIARYHNYQYNRDDSQKARAYLDKIKPFCNL